MLQEKFGRLNRLRLQQDAVGRHLPVLGFALRTLYRLRTWGKLHALEMELFEELTTIATAAPEPALPVTPEPEPTPDEISFLEFSFDDHDYWLAVKDHTIIGDTHDVIIDALKQGYSAVVPVMELLLKAALPGARVIDIGAHIGTFSVPAAALGCSVVAIEGSDKNIELLRAGIERNRFYNLTAIHAAATDYDGEAVFRSYGPWGGLIPKKDNYSRQAANISTVQAVTVDSIVATLRWNHVDFVKIDVEGGETAAFAGMTGLLTREDAPIIAFEGNNYILQARGTNAEAMIASLNRYGFECYVCLYGKLCRIESDYVQVAPVTDYVAAKKGANLPQHVARAGWTIEPPMGPDEIQQIAVALVTECEKDAQFKVVLLQALENQPEKLRRTVQIETAIKIITG